MGINTYFRRMNRHSLRLMTLLGGLSVGGLLLIQFLWIRQAYITESRTFDHNVHLALRNVVESLCQTDGLDVPAYNPIEQLSSNYYVVKTSQVLQPETLEYFLSAELNKRNIVTDFEYGIYDCQSQHMVYGNEVTEKPRTVRASLPSLKEDQYYFGVLFPSRQTFLLGRIDFLMYLSGGIMLVIGFFVSSIVMMTKQKRLSEVQRDFINNMTHEFKTPLATIKLSAEVIRGAGAGENSERLRKYVSLIEKEADRLKSHVDEVLQVAQIEKSKLALNIKTHELKELLSTFEKTAGEKIQLAEGNWSFQNNCLSAKIPADALHFQNILGNLLDNSLKYTDRKPAISLTAAVRDKKVVLTFSDNGKGITEKDLKHIFKKFYRVPIGDLQGIPGFGLGLFYVKQVLKAHGGSIKAESKYGEGTTFYIQLPIAKADEKS